jgi:hypothetical protein
VRGYGFEVNTQLLGGVGQTRSCVISSGIAAGDAV